MKKLSSTLPNMLLSLGGICVLVSGILAVVNKVTTAPIAEAEMRAKVEANTCRSTCLRQQSLR